MKHLKTILIAVMMFVMAISFAACGTTGNTPNTGDNGSGIVIGGGGDESQTPDNGDNGDNGETPDNGDNGNSGETPDNGDSGDNGETPDNGDSGDNGETPDNGDSGDNGETPDNGDSGDNGETPDNGDNGETPDNGDNGETPDNGDNGDNGEDDEPSILVVYFSCTNTTKGWAQTLQARLDADIYEIVPAIPYTADDLKYYTNCRADQEQADPTARPAISGSVENIEQYDVIYIGYPIWHGQAPKIIYTFLESYDFDGVTIIPFCTSASSGMGSSGTNLHSSAPNAIWKSGCRVSSSSNIDSLVNEIKR